jgi:hypothetical protein
MVEGWEETSVIRGESWGYAGRSLASQKKERNNNGESQKGHEREGSFPILACRPVSSFGYALFSRSQRRALI